MAAITPRPYQVDLIERVRGQMRQGVKRVLVQAPVGAGKTIISSEMVRGAIARGKRVLFLAHRRRLVEQKSGKLDDFGVEHAILMNGFSSNPTHPVQVASRDTFLSRVVRNGWIDLPPADLVLVDEAHRVLSEQYSQILSMYPASWHLGFTATPCRDDGRGLGDFYQAIECACPISELIRDGFLCPVTCYAPQNYGKRNVSSRKLAGDPVSQWKRLAAGRPTILFAAKVDSSKAVCDAFNAAGIAAEHMDAHTPDDERDAIIARVESGLTQILCNVGVNTEGVDIPCLSCCILLRLAGSYVLFIQAVGRIMRSHPGKTDAILLDHSDAVLEHGFPDEDVRWELAESETVDARNKKDREDGKRKSPVACPKCGVFYSGTVVCPACGYRLPRKLQPVALKNQLLAEVDKALSPEQLRETQVRYWMSCLRIMAFRNQTTGAAAQMYRSRYKQFPPEDFPSMPERWQWRERVADVFPQYAQRVPQ